MTSIQKLAAELAEEWKNSDCSNLRELERNGDKMAALLRQIASMGGDVEPVAELVLQDIGRPFSAMQVRVQFFGAVPAAGDRLFTQQALDAAWLAGFEAGRNKGWAVGKIESLIQERDAAIARADSAFEAGRRSQQEENQRLLAEVCRLQPLAEQRDAALARAESAFEDGRRKGLQDAANKAEAISEEERRFGEHLSHDPVFSFIQADAMAIVADAIRELINKEA